MELGWFKRCSKVVTEVVTSKFVMHEIEQLSPSTLGPYHSVICYFAPNFNHFCYETMKARCALAALYLNDNANRF